MNIQQIRYVREIVRQGLNLTAAARALHTSQPGISRQVMELEDELDIKIFVRAGRRITGLTPARWIGMCGNSIGPGSNSGTISESL